MYRIFVAHVSVSRECRSCVSGSELNMCGRNEKTKKHNRFFSRIRFCGCSDAVGVESRGTVMYSVMNESSYRS